MRSRQLETAITDYVQAAASHLDAEVEAGAEIPFELGSSRARGRITTTPLYCYRALTGAFIEEREGELKRLPGHAEATKLLKAVVEDVFAEQTDFQVRPERLRQALDRLERAAAAEAGRLELVATLHGLEIASAELSLTKGLLIVHPDAVDGVAQLTAADEPAGGAHHLLVVHTPPEENAHKALAAGRQVLADLLRALRLFADGHITMGAIAWSRLHDGAFSPLALATGGSAGATVVVTPEQEDELRAFCSLVSRRAPREGELAWALRRFDLGCERDSPTEALSDHLLALRALLEPEGPTSALLPGRLAALCATPEDRAALAEQITQAVALERQLIAGVAVKQAPARLLCEAVANHLRALLSDVICGHLDADLVALADELLLAPPADDGADDGADEQPAEQTDGQSDEQSQGADSS
jgi:hypothetical protein